jgi:hypothetical protein
MSTNCCRGCESKFTTNWQKVRCNFKFLKKRLLVYNDESPCASPFAEPTGINWIDWFPVAGYNLDISNAQIEDRKATIEFICEPTQKIVSILGSNKVILLDMDTETIVCSGKIKQVDVQSNTDVIISISMIRNPYSFAAIFP